MKVNINQEVEISIAKDSENMEVVAISKHLVQFRFNQKNYSANYNLDPKDHKKMIILFRNKIFSIYIKDKLDELIDSIGLSTKENKKVNEMKAPMPGLIKKILVSNHEKVEKGQNILVIEAMKMENVLTSPMDGVIADIEVIEGESIEKNKILLRFD